MKFVFFYCTFLLLLHISKSEIFTAVTQLKALLNTQSVVVSTLEKYIEGVEKNLKRLKINFQEFRNEHDKSSKNAEEYLGNPINDFLLIKRLTSDWTEIQSLMKDNKLSEMIQNLRNNSNESLVFPTEEDLTGAANGLIRLQEFYALNPAAIAKGELNGHQYNNKLSANDCYLLGKAAYDEKHYYNSVQWMTEAIRLWQVEVNKTIDISTVLTLRARAYYNENDPEKALKLLEESLKISPNDEILLDRKEKLKEDLKQKNASKIRELDPEFHKKLCRNKVKLHESVKAKLKCKYMDFGNIFLKLAKFKVEEVSFEPRIILYHDVISDTEIEIIKNLSTPKLKRATIYYPKSNKTENNSDRIGQLSWLGDDIHPVIKILNRRVEDMTGLSTKISESLQVVNYGIGGFFNFHFDAVRKENDSADEIYQTNRLATVLFYVGKIITPCRNSELPLKILPKGASKCQQQSSTFHPKLDVCFMILKSGLIKPPTLIAADGRSKATTDPMEMSDVAQGGGTVFPSAIVSIQPKKGTAAFWQNLLPNLSTDFRTSHAACPVLLGSKWICTKWLQIKGQKAKCRKKFGRST